MRSTVSPRIRVATLVSAAAILAAIAPATASAQVATGSLGGSSSPTATTAALAPVGDGSPAAVADYWNPARMRGAQPADLVLPATGPRPAPTPAPPTGAPTARGGEFRPAADQAAPVPKVGKIFFTRGGQDFVCSGSSVTADNRNLVATAGHCTFANGQWVSRFVFVPAYDNGNAPYGQFSGIRVVAPNGWIQGQSLDSDTAFVTVAPVRGRSLADTVGAFGVGFNAARDIDHTAHGYPAQSPFNGQQHYTCTGPNSSDGTRLGIDDCGMNGGASGGPWIGNGVGNGVQVSVNSYIHQGGRGIYGPYWGDEIQDAYQNAQSA